MLVGLVALPAPAGGGGEASSRFDVYDDGWITVYRPAVRGSWEGTRLGIAGGVSVDALSGATPLLLPDVVSSATPFSEVRREVDLAVTRKSKTPWTVTYSAGLSTEPDYTSLLGGTSASRELVNRRALLELGLGLNRDVMGDVHNARPREQTLGVGAQAGWTHILTQTTRGVLRVELGQENCGPEYGCSASPYRWVTLVDSDGLPWMAVPERHPDRRSRGAVAGRISHAIDSSTAVHGGYRFAADSWGVRGHTSDLALARSLSKDRLLMKVDGRRTWQSPANFWQATVPLSAASPAAPSLRSADRELGGQRNLSLGTRAEWSLYGVGKLQRLGISVRGSRQWYRYLEVPDLPRRDARVVGGGIDAEW